MRTTTSPAVSHLRGWAASVLVLAVFTAGCGGGDDDAGGVVADPGQTSTTSSPTSNAAPWPELDEPTAPGDEAALDSAPAPEPDSREITTPVDIKGSIGEPTTADADPCHLVPLPDWAAWLNQPGATAHEIEDGTVCGYQGGDDTVRMALGVLPLLAASTERFLPPDVTGAPQTLKDTAKVTRTRWVERYPIAESSVLVVEGTGFDLVVEMSTRGSRSQDDLRLAAIAFAEGALGRVR